MADHNFFYRQVVRGKLPAQFYEAWRLWRMQSKSESAGSKAPNLLPEAASPDSHSQVELFDAVHFENSSNFEEQQCYFIIKCTYAGEPAHDWRFKNAGQIDSFLLQTCVALAQAEEVCAVDD
jgi:hypothetical protein